LIFQHLVENGFETPRSILSASQAELEEKAGVGSETADRIFEQILKDYLHLQDKSSTPTEEVAIEDEE